MTSHGLFLESYLREIMYHRDFSNRQQLNQSAHASACADWFNCCLSVCYGAALFRLPVWSNSQESFLVSWKPLPTEGAKLIIIISVKEQNSLVTAWKTWARPHLCHTLRQWVERSLCCWHVKCCAGRHWKRWRCPCPVLVTCCGHVKCRAGRHWKRWRCPCPVLVTWCGHVKCRAGRHWKRWWCPMSCVSYLVCLGVELFSPSVCNSELSHSNWDLYWWAPWSDETEDGGCYSCWTTHYNFSMSQTPRFCQSQIPWRLYQSRLVETLNWGPLCMYPSKKVMYARWITCKRSESARERRIVLYKSDQ